MKVCTFNDRVNNSDWYRFSQAFERSYKAVQGKVTKSGIDDMMFSIFSYLKPFSIDVIETVLDEMAVEITENFGRRTGLHPGDFTAPNIIMRAREKIKSKEPIKHQSHGEFLDEFIWKEKSEWLRYYQFAFIRYPQQKKRAELKMSIDGMTWIDHPNTILIKMIHESNLTDGMKTQMWLIDCKLSGYTSREYFEVDRNIAEYARKELSKNQNEKLETVTNDYPILPDGDISGYADDPGF